MENLRRILFLWAGFAALAFVGLGLADLNRLRQDRRAFEWAKERRIAVGNEIRAYEREIREIHPTENR